MADNWTPVSNVTYSDTHKQANHPTPGSGNALHQPAPVEDFMDDEPDASDVADAADFDEI